MDATATKDLLHLRIEQADEKLLAVLAELTESLFRSYQPEVVEEVEDPKSEVDYAALYAEHLKPMTREEMTNELRESMADYEKGDYITLEEMEKESATW